MSDVMLSIRQLTVEVEGRKLLHNIGLEIKSGETHVLFGPKSILRGYHQCSVPNCTELLKLAKRILCR
jgi:ABC-type iron transport system FetAB ATPase subunit